MVRVGKAPMMASSDAWEVSEWPFAMAIGLRLEPLGTLRVGRGRRVA